MPRAARLTHHRRAVPVLTPRAPAAKIALRPPSRGDALPFLKGLDVGMAAGCGYSGGGASPALLKARERWGFAMPFHRNSDFFCVLSPEAAIAE